MIWIYMLIGFVAGAISAITIEAMNRQHHCRFCSYLNHDIEIIRSMQKEINVLRSTTTIEEEV